MTTLPPVSQDVKIAAYPFLAESIMLANQYAQARWGLTPRTSDGFTRLNVAWTEVLTVGPLSVRVFVDGTVASTIPEIKSGEMRMEADSESGGDVLRSSPGSRLVEVPRGPRQSELLLLLLPAHAENIRKTAERSCSIGRTVKSAHSDEAVRELGSFIGRELPLPWYSTDIQSEEQESDVAESRFEGDKRAAFSTRRERNAKNRKDAVRIHGVTCKCCGFNFEAIYGEHGSEYIQVHHLDVLSENTEEILVDPKSDLTVVCANCHAMLHRDRSKSALTLEELRSFINPRFSEFLSKFGSS